MATVLDAAVAAAEAAAAEPFEEVTAAIDSCHGHYVPRRAQSSA